MTVFGVARVFLAKTSRITTASASSRYTIFQSLLRHDAIVASAAPANPS